MAGLRDTLLKVRDAAAVPIVMVPTPEWPEVDGKLYVRMQSAYESDRALPQDEGEQQDENHKAKYLCRVICDENRNRVLQDDDAPFFGHKEASVVNRLYWAALDLNGLTEKNRDTVRKNSPGTEGGGSPSSSPEPSQQATDST
jgi:hypothetical protein